MNPQPKSRLLSHIAPLDRDSTRDSHSQTPQASARQSAKIAHFYEDLPLPYDSCLLNSAQAYFSSMQQAQSQEKDEEESPKNPASTTSRSAPVTKSIPIQGNSGLKRSGSELRLLEEQEMADFRDYVFFSRLVEGIAHSHDKEGVNKDHEVSEWLQLQNDMCLARIIGTRNGRMDQADGNHRQPRIPSKGNLPDYYYYAPTASPYHPNTSSTSNTYHTSSTDEIFTMDL